MKKYPIIIHKKFCLLTYSHLNIILDTITLLLDILIVIKEPYDRTKINRYLYDYNHLLSNAAYFDYTSYQNTYIPGKLEITKLNQVAVPILTNDGRFDNIVGGNPIMNFGKDYSKTNKQLFICLLIKL